MELGILIRGFLGGQMCVRIGEVCVIVERMRCRIINREHVNGREGVKFRLKERQ
jgi:hypothetical protein